MNRPLFPSDWLPFVSPSAIQRRAPACAEAAARPHLPLRPTFEDVYEQHSHFVLRSVAALGVPPAQIDDAAQEVFLVVHRRLASFEGRSSLRTWVYGIVVHVARGFRRTQRRKHANEQVDVYPLADVLAASRGTAEHVAQADDVRRFDRLLASLDDDKREVLVLAELEELTAVEISEILGVSPNTVASRLRAAKKAFDLALDRERSRERGR